MVTFATSSRLNVLTDIVKAQAELYSKAMRKGKADRSTFDQFKSCSRFVHVCALDLPVQITNSCLCSRIKKQCPSSPKPDARFGWPSFASFHGYTTSSCPFCNLLTTLKPTTALLRDRMGRIHTLHTFAFPLQLLCGRRKRARRMLQWI